VPPVGLIAFALTLWSAHQINEAVAEDIKAVLMVDIFIPYPMALPIRAIHHEAR